MSSADTTLEFDRLSPSQVRSLTQLQLVIAAPEAVSTLALEPGRSYVVGRGPEADIRFDHQVVSRPHARLTVLEDGVEVEDLDSANGTLVAGVPLRRGCLVARPGETITIGLVTLVVHRLPVAAGGRRIWSHVYFLGRLEEECLRATSTEASFSVLMLRLARDLSDAEVVELVGSEIGPGDLLAHYGASDWEVLCLHRSQADVAAVATRIAQAFEPDRQPRWGLASYGSGGRDPASLVASARAALAGTAAAREPSGKLQAATGARMRAVFELAERAAAARSDTATVLLLGETGVGKTMLARWIHDHSPRRNARFERVDLTCIPATLIEDALFGHAKGAFSGAVRDQPGPFELAEGGSVQLDEVGELPLNLQVKLLSLLQERVVSRLGETRPRPIDVRVIASTNRDLQAAVARGEFRADLYFRLNVIPLVLPPLRQRREEIAGLARSFLEQAAADEKLRAVPILSPAAQAALESYDWPGNVRELENAMRRAAILCTGQTIEPDDLGLPTAMRDDGALVRAAEESGDLSGLSPAQCKKRSELLALLESKQWVVERAVREYGICKASFYKLMRELKIPLRQRP